MAETLANGTTIPQGSDPIHGSGVQAMRNLGGSVDGQLGNRYTKAQADALLAGKAPVSHTHSWAQVTGKPTVFPPASHTHTAGDVTGLQAQLDALTFDTGERNITSLVNPAENMIAGSVFLRRVGKMVQLSMDALVFTTSAGRIPIVRLGQPLLPVGFRPTRTTFFPYAQRDQNENHGDVRIDGNGYVYLYQVIRSDNLETTPTGTTDTAYFRASALFPTSQAVPTALPGTPA